MKLEIEKQKLEEAYKTASPKGKELLGQLFSREECLPEKKKPSLDDYTTITSYIDACIVTGTPAILTQKLLDDGVPPHIIALMKLETISCALWGRNYQPNPDVKGDSHFYFPWFTLWNEREIKGTDELVYIPVIDALNTPVGFGFANTYYPPSHAYATVGSRLWQETPEKAKYFGEKFIDLWFDFLGFNCKRADNGMD